MKNAAAAGRRRQIPLLPMRITFRQLSSSHAAAPVTTRLGEPVVLCLRWAGATLQIAYGEARLHWRAGDNHRRRRAAPRRGVLLAGLAAARASAATSRLKKPLSHWLMAAGAIKAVNMPHTSVGSPWGAKSSKRTSALLPSGARVKCRPS